MKRVVETASIQQVTARKMLYFRNNRINLIILRILMRLFFPKSVNKIWSYYIFLGPVFIDNPVSNTTSVESATVKKLEPNIVGGL